MRECDRCGKKIRYGSLCERCNGYLEGLMQNRKREADICRGFAEKVKQMMKMPEYGFCDIERIMEIALEEMESGE